MRKRRSVKILRPKLKFILGPNTLQDNAGYTQVPVNDSVNNNQHGSSLMPDGSGDRLLAESNDRVNNNSRSKKPAYSPLTKWGTLFVLFIVNLLNYMDRFTIVGVLSAVQHEFDIGKTKAGLLQTVFMISYGFLNLYYILLLKIVFLQRFDFSSSKS